jgi:hypothetical protein
LDDPLAVSDASASNQERDLGDQAQDVAREAANSRWVDRVARAGLVARAVIYLIVGYLAGRLALGSAGSPKASTHRPASGEGAHESLSTQFDRWNAALLRQLVAVRTGWLTALMLGVNAALASRWTVRILRLRTLAALVGLRRWRHLLTFLGSVIAVELAAFQLSILIASPRPLDVRIIGNWEGHSSPSTPVAALAVTLVGMAYALLPRAGRDPGPSGWPAQPSWRSGSLGCIWRSTIRPTSCPRSSSA